MEARFENPLDEWTEDFLERAITQYEEETGIRKLPSDFFLYMLLDEPYSLLTSYMIENKLFSWCFRELSECTIIDNLEMDCYARFLEFIQEKYDIAYKYNKETQEEWWTLALKCDNGLPYTEKVEEILCLAEEISINDGKDVIDEESLTKALVNSENIIWEEFEEFDTEGIAIAKIKFHFSIATLKKHKILA